MQLQFLKSARKKVVALISVIAGILFLFQLQCTPGQKSLFPFTRFEKCEKNPILSPRGNGFESKAVFNPGVILDDDTFYMFYRAQDESGRSTIGLALSEDGINFSRYPEPVITPEYDYELPGGCEDPRIVKIGDTYYISYTGYSPKGTPSCLAVSKDLMNWKKLGPITPNKSAAILRKKINGKCWLYFGDTNIWVAHSTDMIHWEVVDGPVMRPRKGYFDEELVEPGPPPIITEEGILLIYNGNIPEQRARESGKKENRTKIREYSIGWAIFSHKDPTKLIARCEDPLLTPTESFEKVGQVDDVVFSEGLVKKDGKSYLYYGCADTYISVAISDKTWQEPQISPGIFCKIVPPILLPEGDGFECGGVYNPTVIAEDTLIFMIYRAVGEGTGSGAFGLAWSKDGIKFNRYEKNPIMISEYNFEECGCEDPRVVKVGDTYYLFYDGGESIYEKPETTTPGNICLATSKDLVHWKKHGEILQPINDWESGQIKAPAPIPQKIKGRYWMYYQGEIEPWWTKIGIAYSEDLIHWTQVLGEPTMTPRENYFDSWGTEPGVAVVIDEGILLIYNGWGGDGTNTNKTGWALFSKEDPAKLIARCNSPIISLPHDHVFTEGMVRFKDKWYLYYGAADKWIEGVVVDSGILHSEINLEKIKD